jgi:uncharacterized protein (DUF111 family)
MKKGRPGVLLAVQCRPADADELATIVFRETTALGLRRSTVMRQTLPRRSITVATPYGDVPGVVATMPDGGERYSAEYEACADAARKLGIPLEDVAAAARQAYRTLQAR